MNFFRPEDDSDELSDRDVNKLLIVTQEPSTRAPKHEGYDRTGDWTTRVKITQELEQAINDGLYYYEEDLWISNDYDRNTSGSYKTVNIITQEVFEKIAPRAPKKQNPEVPPPPPPVVIVLFIYLSIVINNVVFAKLKRKIKLERCYEK